MSGLETPHKLSDRAEGGILLQKDGLQVFANKNSFRSPRYHRMTLNSARMAGHQSQHEVRIRIAVIFSYVENASRDRVL